MSFGRSAEGLSMPWAMTIPHIVCFVAGSASESDLRVFERGGGYRKESSGQAMTRKEERLGYHIVHRD